MEQSPYPQELLQASVSDRVRFFVDYTMAHPHLIKAFNEVMQSVYHAPGISLISDEKAQTITLSDLQRHAPSVRQCLVMLKSISLGEQQLQESEEDLLKLQKALKLTNTSQATAEVKGAKSKKGQNNRKKTIGKASPRRYPLKKGEEDSDSFHSL